MTDAASSRSSRGPRMLALWHLLALLADVGVIGAAIVIASRAGLRFGSVHNLSVLTMGAALSVVSSTAAWLALGPLAISVRIVGAPLVCLAALVAATIALTATGANPEAIIGTFLAGIAQFLLLQAPYWLLRSWHRLRIVPVDELDLCGPIERLQYSLWQMLVVMTLIAVALGIGRGIIFLAGNSRGPSGTVVVLTSFFALLVGYNLLLAWPLIWAVLSPTGVVWKVASAIVLTGLVVVVAHPLTKTVLGPGEGSWIYWLVFVPQPAYLLTHLLATRISGYRLVRLVQ
jgi:hypothetical protein